MKNETKRLSLFPRRCIGCGHLMLLEDYYKVNVWQDHMQGYITVNECLVCNSRRKRRENNEK